MYRVVLLLAISLTVVVAHPHMEGMPKCGHLMHGGMACCKKEMPQPNFKALSDEVKNCFQAPKKPPPSCDLEICIAKKKGVASDDGTIDKKKMSEEIKKRFETDSDLADIIIENCVDGDLSKYGPPDFCDLMKQKMCTEVQIIKSCDEWNDQGDCNGMKELAEECVKQFT